MAADMDFAQCPQCGPTTAEDHPRLPVKRCRNCKEHLDQEADEAPCAATFREEPMWDTVYCGERGYHQRHTAWQGSNYYAWRDGDEGAGWDPMQ